eukprot:1196786-Amphidinium_carterae.1
MVSAFSTNQLCNFILRDIGDHLQLKAFRCKKPRLQRVGYEHQEANNLTWDSVQTIFATNGFQQLFHGFMPSEADVSAWSASRLPFITSGAWGSLNFII